MNNRTAPGLSAMLIRVVIKLGGWHPCPVPPYCILVVRYAGIDIEELLISD